jgi:hypothetical protein
LLFLLCIAHQLVERATRAASVHLHLVLLLLDRLPTIGSHDAPANHQSPIANHQSPIANHQYSITNYQSPITNHQSDAHACSHLGLLLLASSAS